MPSPIHSRLARRLAALAAVLSALAALAQALVVLHEPHAGRRQPPGVRTERRNEISLRYSPALAHLAVDRVRFYCTYRPVLSRVVLAQPDPRRALVQEALIRGVGGRW